MLEKTRLVVDIINESKNNTLVGRDGSKVEIFLNQLLAATISDTRLNVEQSALLGNMLSEIRYLKCLESLNEVEITMMAVKIATWINSIQVRQ